MNTLSILIYAAEAVDNLREFFCVFGVIFTVGGVPLLIAGINTWYRYSSVGDDEWAATMKRRDAVGRWGRILIVIGPLLILTSALMPSSRAFYLIAASETGEAIVTHPETAEIFGDLRTIIKQRLKKEIADIE